jgi:hypothetical protein
MQIGETTAYKCTKKQTGRYVVVARNKKLYSSKIPFTICEVKVFTTAKLASVAWDTKLGKAIFVYEVMMP